MNLDMPTAGKKKLSKKVLIAGGALALLVILYIMNRGSSSSSGGASGASTNSNGTYDSGYQQGLSDAQASEAANAGYAPSSGGGYSSGPDYITGSGLSEVDPNSGLTYGDELSSVYNSGLAGSYPASYLGGAANTTTGNGAGNSLGTVTIKVQQPKPASQPAQRPPARPPAHGKNPPTGGRNRGAGKGIHTHHNKPRARGTAGARLAGKPPARGRRR